MSEIDEKTQEQDVYREVEDIVKYGFYLGYTMAIKKTIERLNESIKDSEAQMDKLKEGSKLIQSIEFELTEDSHDNNQT